MKRKTGQAVFIKAGRTAWEIRKATKQALHDGEQTKPYVIIQEDCFPGMPDMLLKDPAKLKKRVLILGGAVCGKTDDAYRCAALWNQARTEGVLVHREDSGIWLAYLPPVTYQSVQNEERAAKKLVDILLSPMGDIPMMMDEPIPAGRYTLGELLSLLTFSLEVEP